MQEESKFPSGPAPSPLICSNNSDPAIESLKVDPVHVERFESDPALHDDDRVTLKTWLIVVVKLPLLSGRQTLLTPNCNRRCFRCPTASHSGQFRSTVPSNPC